MNRAAPQAAKPRPPQLSAPWVPKLIKYMSAFNVRLYRATDGRLGGTWRIGSTGPRGLPVCLLTHRGRKSGKAFTAPLLYLPDGDRVVLVASQGGLPKHPQWYWNIKAHPRVLLQTGRVRRRMLARVADPTEREQLWPRLVEMYPDFENYQSWTDRVIPVVVCEPA